MGKKKCRAKKTSKGIHSAVSKSSIAACRTDPGQRLINRLKAWKKGQNPWVTIFDPHAPADRQYRRARAHGVWGDPRKKYNIYGPKKEDSQAA